MNIPRVAVLRGGPSAEYDISLATGANVLDVLRSHFKDRYVPIDVFIDRQGRWHIEGLEVAPERALHRFDVAFNALHGAYGEDGKVQSFLEAYRMPFTGSGSLGSAVAMNKALAKKVLADQGIKTAYGREILAEAIAAAGGAEAVARELFNTFPLPAIIKPVSSGSSVGISIARTFPELLSGLQKAAEQGSSILVEEFIPGIEATCGVIEGFRGEELYALPPVEIRHHSDFFDHQAKYGGASEEIVPATFADEHKRAIEDLARRAHRALGLRHYSRSDFIVSPRRGIYILETNTLPGLTDESLLPKSLRAVGSGLHDLVGHLIQWALA